MGSILPGPDFLHRVSCVHGAAICPLSVVSVICLKIVQTQALDWRGRLRFSRSRVSLAMALVSPALYSADRFSSALI